MDEQDLIRDDMANTRAAISEKLGKLEDRVASTVQEATQEVAQTVTTVTDTVQDTVQTVKATVDDTLATVKDGVSAIQSLFDLPRHVERYPWVVLGGSLACGFVLGEFLFRHHRPPPPQRRHPSPDFEEPTKNAPNGHVNASKGSEVPRQSAASDSFLEQIAPDLSKLKGLAVGTFMGTIRDMITHAVGDNLRHSLSEVIDSVTEKMGGKVVPAKLDSDGEHDSDSMDTQSGNQIRETSPFHEPVAQARETARTR